MTGQVKNEIDVLLAKSLKELAAEKPIEKITIKEITNRAGVIRPTFYNHFQDKYELMEWIIHTELLEPIRDTVHELKVSETMVALLDAIREDKVFYNKAVRMEGVVTFDEILHKCLKEEFLGIIQNRLSEDVEKYKWLTPNLIATLYTQSLCYIIVSWIKGRMTVPPEEIAEAFGYMMVHSVKDILKKEE